MDQWAQNPGVKFYGFTYIYIHLPTNSHTFDVKSEKVIETAEREREREAVKEKQTKWIHFCHFIHANNAISQTHFNRNQIHCFLYFCTKSHEYHPVACNLNIQQHNKPLHIFALCLYILYPLDWVTKYFIHFFTFLFRMTKGKLMIEEV